MVKHSGGKVSCPVCGWRLFDRITPLSGEIQMKCPHCHQTVTVELTFPTVDHPCSLQTKTPSKAKRPIGS